jgi:hypothetical protein
LPTAAATWTAAAPMIWWSMRTVIQIIWASITTSFLAGKRRILFNFGWFQTIGLDARHVRF